MASTPKQFTLKELAQITNTTVIGDADYYIYGVDNLEDATPTDLSFLANPCYEKMMMKSSAGVIIVDQKSELLPGRNFLVSEHPSRSFQQVVELFFNLSNHRTGFKNIHPSAVIHENAHIEEGVRIGPNTVIDQNVYIDQKTVIGSHVYIGSGVHIGKECIIYSNATIRESCILANRVILQPGVVIGSCGFGYFTDSRFHHRKLEQLGGVIIEDDVEIGANSTIDRARFKMTTIKKGTKIDNLVQIGHGVTLGEDNLIVAQCGIAGSSKTGRNVVLAGQSGVVGHVSISDGITIAGRGAVTKNLKKPGRYGGVPAFPEAHYKINQVHMRNLSNYVNRIKKLEEKILQLESLLVPEKTS